MGPNFIDRLKMRFKIDIKYFFTLDFDEVNTNGKQVAYKAGPVQLKSAAVFTVRGTAALLHPCRVGNLKEAVAKYRLYEQKSHMRPLCCTRSAYINLRETLSLYHYKRTFAEARSRCRG